MFDWREYYELARMLAGCDDEACERSAISRAYYAAFCGARNAIAGSIPIKDDHTAHSLVWRCYSMGEHRYRRIGQNGDRLKGLRRAADYDNQIKGLKETTKFAIKLAGSVLDDLSRFGER